MALNTLKRAKRLLAARRFPSVIALLQPLVIEYRESFPFYYMLGTACLYVGDIGGAELYYKRARTLKMMDVDLINAQAVLYLRRGEINKAVEYYLEAQDYGSNNKLSKKALEFIKKNSNPESIIHLVQSGKIKNFYPSLGVSAYIVRGLAIFSLCIVCGLVIFFFAKSDLFVIENRADLSSFVLTTAEKDNALEQDTASSVFKYILTQGELEKAYANAQKHFQEYRDNEAQVEINRILNSNASVAVRQKARLLMDYLDEPNFDTKITNYSYAQIESDPWLYMDSWVIWSGRVTNAKVSPTEYRCDFLVGYDTMEVLEGKVPLVLKQPITINTSFPLEVLAQVGIENGQLLLQGKSIYQSILDND